MPDYPILIFPKPQRVSPPKRRGGGDRPQGPYDPGKHIARVDDLLDSAHKQFSLSAMDTDKVLVLETIGKIGDFHKAVNAIPGLDWLDEIDTDAVELDEDALSSQLSSKDREKIEKSGGRLYLSISNKKAIEQLEGLWQKWKNGEKFPHGSGKWKQMFELLHDLRFWNHNDMVEDTGFLDLLRGQIKNGENVPENVLLDFELELHYRESAKTAQESVDAVKQGIKERGGKVGNEMRIPEIAFHGLKVTMPLVSLRPFLGRDDSLDSMSYLQPSYIKYCRPMALMSDLPSEEPVEGGNFSPLPCDDNLPPAIALLDGAPLMRHKYLDGRIILDDPDDYLPRYRSAAHQIHGTAMASLICHGDLNDPAKKSLRRKIYARPIMVGKKGEHPAPEFFLEDVLVRVVRHIKNSRIAAAPSVCVINLSIGKESTPFLRTISSLARTLDYLSAEYQVLFIVSAGNKRGVEFDTDTSSAGDVIQYVNDKQRFFKIVSPAESMNALTVGALNDDKHTDHPQTDDLDFLKGKVATALYSRLGPGYRNQVKPDIVVSGGRMHYHIKENHWAPNKEYKQQGLAHAFPDKARPEMLSGEKNSPGTSNATALTTHAAGEIYEILEEIRNDSESSFDEGYYALLLKALLVHGASRESISGIYRELLNDSAGTRWKSYFSRFVGYGIPDFERVKRCTESRVVLLGCNDIVERQMDSYTLPIPAECRQSGFVRLIVTLAWFSPIHPKRNAYRQAKLSFAVDGISVTREEYDFQQVQKGTLQHEIFELPVSNLADALKINVSCFPDAVEHLAAPVPYGMAVTLEVAESISIYDDVKNSVKQAITP